MNAALDVTHPIREISGCRPDALPDAVLTSTEPLVLKSLVRDWPAVVHAKESTQQLDDYLRRFYNDEPVTAYRAEPEAAGRIFYNEDFTGFTFSASRLNLRAVLNSLLGEEAQENDVQGNRPQECTPTLYVGSTLLDHWLPGFRTENDLALDNFQPLASIWIGNQSRIAAHYDVPDNIACVVAGRRRFTLFPPEQVKNLYVGPLDFTPSGQPISLVDFHNPDFSRHPRFELALATAQVAELEAGDALFIPSMWWHHVESLASYNVLVNYWWRRTPSYLGAPINVLQHALLSLRGLPLEQRRAWQRQFEHYIFEADEHTSAHIPEASRGVLGPIDEIAARKLRAQLLNKLNR